MRNGESISFVPLINGSRVADLPKQGLGLLRAASSTLFYFFQRQICRMPLARAVRLSALHEHILLSPGVAPLASTGSSAHAEFIMADFWLLCRAVCGAAAEVYDAKMML